MAQMVAVRSNPKIGRYEKPYRLNVLLSYTRDSPRPWTVSSNSSWRPVEHFQTKGAANAYIRDEYGDDINLTVDDPREERRNPASLSFDALDTRRAGAERAKGLHEASGIPRSALGNIDPAEITGAFNIWWEYEGQYSHGGTKTQNRTAFKQGWKEYAKGRRNPTPGKLNLYGLHRIKQSWEYLQGPSDESTLSQYQTYFAGNTVSGAYSHVPFSGFSEDHRPLYTEFKIAGRPPHIKRNPFMESLITGMGTGTGMAVSAGLLAPLVVKRMTGIARKAGLIKGKANPFTRDITEPALKRLRERGDLLVKFSSIGAASNAIQAMEESGYPVREDVLRVASSVGRSASDKTRPYYVVTVGPGRQPGPSELRNVIKRYMAEEGAVARRANPKVGTKDPATMTAAQINAELDKLDKLRSSFDDRLIEMSHGHLGYNEILRMEGPIFDEVRAVSSRRSDLSSEIGLRWGPGAPSRLPIKRGWWGPRKKG